MLTQEETIAQSGTQYSTPASSMQGATGNMNSTPTYGTGSQDFVNALQQRLLSQSDMISSANTGLESKINQAIGGVANSSNLSNQAITSQYDRQIGYTNEAQQNTITAARERGIGMQTTDVAYQAMTKEADKNLKDLEQRKQELILQGSSAAAAKIADLQLQTLTMKTQAMQQTFTNLLGMANFGLQAGQEQRAAQAQDFTQKSTIANIGLQYGIPVGPNDTLQSVVTRAAPLASATQKAQLAKLVADTNLANAQASKAAQDGKVTGNLNDPSTHAAYVAMALNQPDVFNQLMAKDPRLVGIRTDAINQQVSYVDNKVKDLVTKGASYESTKAALESDQSLGANLDPHKTDSAILEAFNKYSEERTKAGTAARSAAGPTFSEKFLEALVHPTGNYGF